MIKFLSRSFSLSRSAMLAAGIAAALAPAVASADSRVNGCKRWNSKPALTWIGAGTPVNATRRAAFALVNAASHGLNPADYRAASLAERFEALAGDEVDLTNPAIQTRIAKFNKDFTVSVLCYLQNVSAGRLNPHRIHKGIWLPRQKFNQYKVLSAAFEEASVADLLSSAAPQHTDYQQLRDVLPQLQVLAQTEANLKGLKRRLKRSIKLDAAHPVIPAVRERLAFLGEIIASGNESDVLDQQLQDAVIRFQTRHGLKADGNIGAKTLAAMAVPMTKRLAQTELAMERLRWYPRNHDNRVVRVNIPAYTMTANAPGSDGSAETLESKVIVGRAGRRHTPLFAGNITRLELSPMWYVPQSIAKSAILPRLRKDPGYLKRKKMEFNLGNGRTSTRVTKNMLNRLARSEVRLQQRSGPSNALGLVKFILPNHRAIYLHDTNRRNLFDRDTRALSYGCVRLEKPLELAKLVLADNPDWTPEAVDKAAASDKAVIAHPSADTMVMLQYQTAVASDAGEIQFYSDVYGMDKKAIRAVGRWNKPKVPTLPNTELLARLNEDGISG